MEHEQTLLMDLDERCLLCGIKQNFALSAGFADHPLPQAGDFSQCMSCGGFTVFTGNGLERRLPNEAETKILQGCMEGADGTVQ